ncbi:MAG TPA: IS21 family transposase [Desulfomonilia bacterium]
MNRRFEVYQYRQVLLHMRQGETDRSIAKARLLGRRKASIVRAIATQEGWLNPDNQLPEDGVLKEKLMPPERRSSTTSSVEPFTELISEWVKNGIQATTIWDALRRDKGFTGHYSSVRRFVQKIRPPTHSPTMILDFKSGEAAQVDFGSGPVVLDDVTGKPVKTWFFVMTLAFSRHQYAELVKNQKVSTWLECHRRAFEFFGGVPQKAIIDNLKSAITRACAFDPEVQRSYEMFAEGYDFLISPCPPADPEKKGRVESGVKYLKNSFMPLRTFRNLSDANRQLKDWVLTTAGARIHGTTGKKPLELFQASEKSFLKPLPTNPPEIVEWAKATLQRNTHVWFDYAWYSAPHGLIGQELWVRAGPQMIQIYHDDKLVAVHPRCTDRGQHQTVTDHLSPACRAFSEQTPSWCLEQATGIGVCCREIIERLLEHPRLDCLRAAQRVIRFRDTYGDDRIEQACEQALACETIKTSTIKGILQHLMQVESHLVTEPRLEAAYRGLGRFVRPECIVSKGGAQ